MKVCLNLTSVDSVTTKNYQELVFNMLGRKEGGNKPKGVEKMGFPTAKINN